MSKSVKLAFIVLAVFLVNSVPGQVLVVNGSNPVDELSPAKVRNIFLGNTINWSSGKSIQIVDYTANKDVREKFSEKFLSLLPNKVSMIWIKVSLSGKSKPPKIFKYPSDLMEYISEHPDAIGYIPENQKLIEGVKTVKIKH